MFFRLRLKEAGDAVWRSDGGLGRLFQDVGPVYVKALCPERPERPDRVDRACRVGLFSDLLVDGVHFGLCVHEVRVTDLVGGVLHLKHTQAHRYTERQTNRERERDRQTDRQTDRHTHTHTHTFQKCS